MLGGVFNPPHVGHLVSAQEALTQLDLARVVFVPVGEAPHRRIEDDPGAEARVEMCRLAIEGDDRFELSELEVNRPGPSYTVDTLREARRAAPDAAPVLVLGADQAVTLPSWHEPRTVLELATLAVSERGAAGRQEVLRALSGLSDADRVAFFDMPRIDVSSSLVRERARGGRPIRYLVPDAVATFIGDGGLYRAPSAVGAE